MHREEFLRMIEEDWTLTQLISYINELKKRIEDTKSIIKELQVIKRRMSRKNQSFENGPRGGM